MKAIINERTYQLNTDRELDLVEARKGEYHLVVGNQGYNCLVLERRINEKIVVVNINGQEYTVQLKDETDELVDRLGLAVVQELSSNDILAPMPGLVLDIMVEVGQEIEAGTPLLILEAMKMENVLKAEGSGTVKFISVEKGTAVDKRQLLIEIE